jgi:hypothetical protein
MATHSRRGNLLLISATIYFLSVPKGEKVIRICKKKMSTRGIAKHYTLDWYDEPESI